MNNAFHILLCTDVSLWLSHRQIMQLVNQIIYSNIYSFPVETSLDVETPNAPPENLKEGHLLLQRGGLASFKWKRYQHFLSIAKRLYENVYGLFCVFRYEAHLQSGLLTLLPVAQQPVAADADAFVSSSEYVCHFSDVYASVNNHRCDGGDGTAVVIHLSDGNVRVETSGAPDTFTVLNGRNDFLWVTRSCVLEK